MDQLKVSPTHSLSASLTHSLPCSLEFSFTVSLVSSRFPLFSPLPDCWVGRLLAHSLTPRGHALTHRRTTNDLPASSLNNGCGLEAALLSSPLLEDRYGEHTDGRTGRLTDRLKERPSWRTKEERLRMEDAGGRLVGRSVRPRTDGRPLLLALLAVHSLESSHSTQVSQLKLRRLLLLLLLGKFIRDSTLNTYGLIKFGKLCLELYNSLVFSDIFN